MSYGRRAARRDSTDRFLVLFAAMTGQRVVVVGGTEAQAEQTFDEVTGVLQRFAEEP